MGRFEFDACLASSDLPNSPAPDWAGVAPARSASPASGPIAPPATRPPSRGPSATTCPRSRSPTQGKATV